MNMELIAYKMKEAQPIEVEGAVLLFLADAMRERYVALVKGIAQASNAAQEDRLMDDAEATEAVGATLLRLIAGVFGKDFLDAFLENKVDVAALAVAVNRLKASEAVTTKAKH